VFWHECQRCHYIECTSGDWQLQRRRRGGSVGSVAVAERCSPVDHGSTGDGGIDQERRVGETKGDEFVLFVWHC